MSWRLRDAFDHSNSSFAIDEGPFLFAPASRRQNEVGQLGCMSGCVHVLDDQKIQFGEQFSCTRALNPGMSGIRGNDPKSSDLARFDAAHDLVIGPTGLRRDFFHRDVQYGGHFLTMHGVCKIVVPHQVGRIAKEA